MIEEAEDGNTAGPVGGAWAKRAADRSLRQCLPDQGATG